MVVGQNGQSGQNVVGAAVCVASRREQDIVIIPDLNIKATSALGPIWRFQNVGKKLARIQFC